MFHDRYGPSFASRTTGGDEVLRRAAARLRGALPGKPVTLLQAGCLAPLRELGIGELVEGGFEISVTAVDADHPLAKRALEDARTGYDDVIVGDLRTVPIGSAATTSLTARACSSASSMWNSCSTGWSAR